VPNLRKNKNIVGGKYRSINQIGKKGEEAEEKKREVHHFQEQTKHAIIENCSVTAT